MRSLPEYLHYLLIQEVLDTGHAPDLASLAALANLSPKDTERELMELEKIHGVVLAPNSTSPWSLHPFAFNPTPFWVTAQRRGWWANCAWCSLGIGAATHQDIEIHTSDGCESQPLQLRIQGGRANRSDVLVHFPYPPARWWDNPYCPCGNILFFTSEVKIDAWCQRHERPRGSVIDISKGIALAERWFGDYASEDWRRKTPQEATQIFKELELDAAFWNIETSFR